MVEPAELSPAKALLLAAKFTTDSNIPALRTLAALHADTFRLTLILRLLLTFLPESTSPSLYVPLVQELASGSCGCDGAVVELDCSSVEDITDAQARKRARRLHLADLPATLIDWQPAPDDITLFLISRAHRVDAQTGLLTLLPQLITPFLNHSECLHTWFISTVLPLFRLSYLYYPQEGATFSLTTFSKLSDEAGVAVLLGRTGGGGNGEENEKTRIGRDLRGLVGPWVCGIIRNKRRKLDGASSDNAPSVHGTKSEIQEHSENAWSYVFQWIVDMATREFPIAVEAIEQWDGPGDVDLGEYGGGQPYMDEDLQASSEKQYAQCAIAATLSTTDTSPEAFEGAQRILVRIASLMDIERPSLDLISSTSHLPSLSPPFDTPKSISLLHLSRRNLLHIGNPITTPTEGLLSLLNALTLSASILGKIGHGLPLVRVAELYLFGTEGDQRGVLQRVLHSVLGIPRRDKKVWRRLRDEIMWLWGWGAENPSAGNGEPRKGHGLLGRVAYDVLEAEMLKALLSDTRYDLVLELYINTSDDKRPIAMDEVEKAVVESAMTSYDNASNGNKTRGGLKRASEAIATLCTNNVPRSDLVRRAQKLIAATHALSFYSLTLQHGVPFQPVNIRVHQDPITLLAKVLEQNSKSYTKLDDLLDIGRNLIEAGLHNTNQGAVAVETQLLENAEKRIIGMAIEAALAEDDFETAYSYVTNRLVPSTATASQTTPSLGTTVQGGLRGNGEHHDDVSWRAAFQAGRFRSTSPPRETRLSASSTANPEIRHLEMRMELLSQSLLLAPGTALPEILGVWRRCEEELNVLLAQETEEAEKWDDKGDKRVPSQLIAPPPMPTSQREGRGNLKSGEEASMGLFDVAKGAAAALSKSAFPLKGVSAAGRPQYSTEHERVDGGPSATGGDSGSISGTDSDGRVRKRDMVSNMVTGGLASGIGWVLGATPVHHGQGRE